MPKFTIKAGTWLAIIVITFVLWTFILKLFL